MDWIVTDNIGKESWRRLLEFSNIDLAVDEIERRHGKPSTPSMHSDHKKQARQVRASILQAKEYFDAARAATMFTSPNHLYYGVVSLSSTLMLLLGDGTRSLDFLRRDAKNAHHGLRFSTGCTAGNAAIDLKLIQDTHVEIVANGHFCNWYSTLPAFDSVYAYTTRQIEGGQLSSKEQVGGFATLPLRQLINSKFSALQLLHRLPDLSHELGRYGVHVAWSRSTHKVHYPSSGSAKHTWFLHGAMTRDDLDAILAQFATVPRFADRFSYSIEEGRTGGIVVFDHDPSLGHGLFQWPSVRETLDHSSISFAVELTTLEIVDCFLLSYQLSMLSRYFPDLWISCLESQCKAAKLIEQTVALLTTKFPLLALSLLSPSGLTISTHREPWKAL